MTQTATEQPLEQVVLPASHGRGSDYNERTQWTTRKARAVYAASHGQRRGFRAWWRTFAPGRRDITIRSAKLTKILDAIHQAPVKRRAS